MKKTIRYIRISEFVFELIGAFSGFIIGTFITEAISAKEFFDNITKSSAIGLVWAAIGFIIAQQHKSHKKIEETLERRMNQIVEFFALGTENGHFEHHLIKLKEHSLGSLRWAVAKFIFHKLNKAFNDVSIIEIDNVDAKEYSKLLSELIKECSESVYMTCPYTPSEWFIELKINTDKCKSSCPDSACTYTPQEKELPEHIKAFCASKAPDKKRIINIPQSKLDVLKQSDKCLISFLNYKRNDRIISLEKDDNIKVRFIKQEDLVSAIGDLKDDDYNILDSKIVMKWDAKRDDGIDDIGRCILIFDNAEVKRHRRIFENVETASYKSYDQLPR